MGFFDFLKKKDSFMDKGPALDSPTSFNDETGLGPPSFQQNPKMASNPFPSSYDYGNAESPSSLNDFKQSSFGQPMQQNQMQNSQFASKDNELINAKLDAIKAMLENITQRLQNLEKEKEKKYW
jgi:hypothetical protein